MRTQDYNFFWQKIHASAKTNGSLLRVMFELTYRCNFACKHCYVPQSYRKYGELKTKEVFSILQQLRDIGCFYLGFTGGEPFVREDIMDILWYAKRMGFEVIVYTNGFFINKNIADELRDLRPNKVDITIHGMTKDVFEGISGVAGSRDKVFRGIELLNKKKVNLGFKTCVLKENKNEIEEIQRFADSIGAGHRLDTMLSARLDGDRKPYEYRGMLGPFSSLSSLCSFKNNEINENNELFKCGVGVTQAAITPLGELKMCLMIDYPRYKILESSLRGAWQRLKVLVKNIKPDENYQCHRCKLEPYCNWCPARAWLYNRSFTSCVPETRRWAELRRQKTEEAEHQLL